MTFKSEITPELLLGMRAAFGRGENAMEFARQAIRSEKNCSASTLVADDLQAGSYVEQVLANQEVNDHWCDQLAGVLSPLMDERSSLLEVGCGEATTLTGVLKGLTVTPAQALGFDISWSRCATGLKWLKCRLRRATLFVADLFSIPLGANSVDVVYTSHSLEPNGGREEEALLELLRIAKRAVVLFEPIYELAPDEARQRMRSHGYVRNLKCTAERVGGLVTDYRLLPYSTRSTNPSGVLVIKKPVGQISNGGNAGEIQWICPFTKLPMRQFAEAFYCMESGLAYPFLGEIPLLRPEHAVLASTFHLHH